MTLYNDIYKYVSIFRLSWIQNLHYRGIVFHV